MPSLGIGVSEAEVEEAIEDLLGDAVVEGQVEPELRTRFLRSLDLVRVSEASYRDFVRKSILGGNSLG